MLSEKARQRLEEEIVIWLTSVRPDGQPQTSVVWFLHDDDEIVVYSKDGTIRNTNVVSNPRVALNLDGDGRGGSVVTIEGTARIDTSIPPPEGNEPYLAKYGALIERAGWTPESFGKDYPVPLRISIDRVRSH